ncbi:uracil phosphoribosyltransferase [Rubritalea squalenifaciens DSM 18772]|uniref:Uracil phosphoribosyltransferase n=1 Tax=Rubritalea squalenifaciens DSM 18772 TaxID=1123071 RepID=A0A1M6L8U3_9BACT|nr:uracil phosphoribosyltransferase [Rubritalea squalenifaciens]SHJ67519.1 uracil phosphoribosyltransferase [Rubritalea squalenifaciens DSM 18772]
MSAPQILNHPVIDDYMAKLRYKECSPEDFRRFVRQIAMLMVPYATSNLPTRSCSVDTPLETASTRVLDEPLILCPILRAGLGLLDGFLTLLPQASVAHIGLARNEETLTPEPYYFNCPSRLSEAEVIVLDPMLATGGSASEAISELKKHGAKKLRFVCIVAAPEGLDTLQSNHPDVPILAANLDRGLNEHGYILPGLGDAGDRIFGTEA